MARLNKIAISLCALLFTSISFTPLAHASGHTHTSATPKAHAAKGTTERKKKATAQKTKSTTKTASKKASTATRTRHPTRTTASSQTALNRQAAGSKKCVLRKGYKKQCAKTIAPAAEPAPVMASVQSKCVVRKGYKKRCKTIAEEPPLTLADAHKARVQRAQSTAMSNNGSDWQTVSLGRNLAAYWF